MFDFYRDYSPWADQITYCPKALKWRKACRDEVRSIRNKIRAGEPKNITSRVKAISTYLMTCHSSFGGLPAAIDILEDENAEVFWRCILRTWNVFDGTWHHKSEALNLFRANKKLRSPHDFLDARSRRFLNKLPNKVRCYRGCSRTRVRGMSWTTSKAVAIAFARGHRSEHVPNPVVATALISKKAIYFPSLDRNESELVIDPQLIRQWERCA